MELTNKWTDLTFVAFDTETSGAYPLGSDIVEFGAVKWRNGQIVDKLQMLLKPRGPMSDFIIGIHGITNAMVADAPVIADKVDEIVRFFADAVIMAHHAPFDMGFLAADLERLQRPLLNNPVICTSLLSRKMIPESANHKLQTLIRYLQLPQGTAHRAMDDAEACLQVGLECLRRMGEHTTLGDALKKQGKPLVWNNFSIFNSRNEIMRELVLALVEDKDLDIVYDGGTVKGKTRRITPLGVVRNPDGDYVMAVCHLDRAQKRFYLNKMRDAVAVPRL